MLIDVKMRINAKSTFVIRKLILTKFNNSK